VRPPAWVYAASLGLGAAGAAAPVVAPELFAAWSGSRAAFVGAGLAALLVHEALHAVCRSRLAPGALVAALALAVLGLVSLPLGWCAFVANLAASGPDAYEEVSALRRSGPRS